MELRETQAPALPPASDTALWQLRKEACESAGFRLQSHQRFLRRILSPDNPTRNLLMVHGTGVGKTCSAIQIAEEYILRPEFQEKRVLVLANPAVQANFKLEIFNVDRVSTDHDVLRSKQCTGRRYLEMLERVEAIPQRWNDPETRERLRRLANDIVKEFYEFKGYREMANEVIRAETGGNMEDWIHATFDNRLVIVDEAHNLRRLEGDEAMSEEAKKVSIALENISKIANGCIFVFLTATPMYDSYAEILFYFNLFLWNDRRQKPNQMLDLDDFFTPNGDLRPTKSEQFRGWVQDYVSFVRGESPFTFPFRLPPPTPMIAPADKTKSPSGKPVKERRKFLDLVGSVAQGFQEAVLKKGTDAASVPNRLATIATPPAPFKMNDEKQYEYTGEAWLAPSKLPQYATKFATVIECIRKGKGVCLVYSNFVEGGANLFSMALEEAGFAPLIGNPLLGNPAQETGERPGAAGKYALITDDAAEARKILQKVRQIENKEGGVCRVIVTSPRVSEGVDFRFVRQVHILDPWFNMSRLEQVVGRGMRTCSHSSLDRMEQNCTVYFHVCRLRENRECLDEYLYRTKVEQKATQIAKVRRVIMESAMDCSLQLQMNSLSETWLDLPVPQHRSQDNKDPELKLGEMMAPLFEEATPLTCKLKVKPEDPEKLRPLSTYLDVRDEILDELQKRFSKKPIWTGDELRQSLSKYQSDVVTFLLQDAARSGITFTDPSNRPAVLQSRGVFYALAPRSGTGNETLVQRLIDQPKKKVVQLPEVSDEAPAPAEVPAGIPNVTELVAEYDWSPERLERYSTETRESYYFDVLMKPELRKAVLLGPSSVWNAPLEQRIDGDRTLHVLGPGELYVNGDRLNEEPTGEVLDALETWQELQFQRFVDLKDHLMATYNPDQGLKLWTFSVEDGTPQRERKIKSVKPTAASSIKGPPLEALAAYLQPPGFAAGLKNKDQRIQELHLMIRQAGPSRIAWWSPEAWSYLESKSPKLLARVARK